MTERAFQTRRCSVIPLHESGIVTSAAFADINQDGWMDLIITGEWMGVKLFINNHGIFKPGEIEHSWSLANYLRYRCERRRLS
jgi:hypothetical protein